MLPFEYQIWSRERSKSLIKVICFLPVILNCNVDTCPLFMGGYFDLIVCVGGGGGDTYPQLQPEPEPKGRWRPGVDLIKLFWRTFTYSIL